MEVEFFLCAKSAVIDAASGKLTILNVIEDLNSVVYPAAAPSLSLVGLISKKPTEPDKLDLNVIITLNNKELFKTPISPSFQGKNRTRIIIGLQGLLVTGPGRLNVSLIYKKKVVSTWHMQAVQVLQSQTAVTVSPPPVVVGTPVQSAPKTGTTRRQRS